MNADRVVCCFLVTALCVRAFTPQAEAQIPSPETPPAIMPQAVARTPARPTANGGSGERDPLPGLPQPPEQPASLFQPPPPGTAYGNPDLESPYFARDPLLDRFQFSQPGWLFDAELDLLGSHVFDHVGQFNSPPPIAVPFVVSVPMARLAWDVSPRFELGYRLPSAFGELNASYRFLEARGSGSTTDVSAAPDGTATLNSHLHIDVADLDYASHEVSLAYLPGANWDMKWRLGLRSADAVFDSRADEPLAEAGSGTAVYERSINNTYWGIGPHAAVELRRRPSNWGLGLVARLDSALLFGKVRQSFVEISTSAASEGFALSNHEQVPILSGFLGLDWRPARCPAFDLQFGVTGEYWWNVGRLSEPDVYDGETAGEIGLYGAFFRVEYNY
jgi:hypothetical protein